MVHVTKFLGACHLFMCRHEVLHYLHCLSKERYICVLSYEHACYLPTVLPSRDIIHNNAVICSNMSRVQTKVGRFIVSPVETSHTADNPHEDSGYSSSSENEEVPSPQLPLKENTLGPTETLPYVWQSPHFRAQSRPQSFALDGGEAAVLAIYQEAVCTKFSELLNLHRSTLLDIIEQDSNGEELLRGLNETKAQLQQQLKRAQEDKGKLRAEVRGWYDKSHS